jgi:NhaP-type Na+/H+ or K+/H+ antiporter
MHGAVSLAAALAIPLRTNSGALFPDRDLIILLTFAVVFGTLVLPARRARRRGVD